MPENVHDSSWIFVLSGRGHSSDGCGQYETVESEELRADTGFIQTPRKGHFQGNGWN